MVYAASIRHLLPKSKGNRDMETIKREAISHCILTIYTFQLVNKRK